MKLTTTFALALAALSLVPVTAAARPGSCALTNDGRQICRGTSAARHTPRAHSRHAGRARVSRRHYAGSDAPAGCPRSLYCGCALSLRLFGRIISPLNASWEWPRRFARDSAAPGNVVFNWRRGGGHVALLLAHVRGTVWTIWDPNNRHRTVIREADIRGRTVVNPRNARYAMR